MPPRKILLHICCAPCAIFPIESLRAQGHEIAGFFYNPNIHPYAEYLKRKGEVERLAQDEIVPVAYGGYDIEDYFQHIVYNEALASRCPVCWWLRLQKTAQHALEHGFQAFTTTLLGSPYQDHEIITKLGEEVAQKAGIPFYYSDFRTGFRAAQAKAHEQGIYCQNYCGCIFSEKERLEKKVSKK